MEVALLTPVSHHIFKKNSVTHYKALHHTSRGASKCSQGKHRAREPKLLNFMLKPDITTSLGLDF